MYRRYRSLVGIIVIMKLYKRKYWNVVFVDWCQEFIWDCIISSSKESLSYLTNDEWIELGKIEKELEKVSKKVFNSPTFNFACLTNNAYRDNEKSHFHLIPRYRNELVY